MFKMKMAAVAMCNVFCIDSFVLSRLGFLFAQLGC